MYTYSLILCFSVFLLIQQHEKQNKGLNYLLLVVEAVFLIFSKNNSDYSDRVCDRGRCHYCKRL